VPLDLHSREAYAQLAVMLEEESGTPLAQIYCLAIPSALIDGENDR